MNGPQLAVAVLSVLIGAMIAVVVAYHPGRARKATYPILCFCAALSVYAWCDFGRFQAINVDASRTETGPSRKKVRKNRPFHFHEFVHYYLGPKYFREVGYLGLYDCILVLLICHSKFFKVIKLSWFLESCRGRSRVPGLGC